MYETSCEIIYDMIAKRIQVIKSCNNLRNEDIFPYDATLISAILNNRRDTKKNVYLFPDRGEYLLDSGRTAKCIEVITENLSLSSPIELILGSKNEIDAYAGYLFRQLVLDALSSENSKTISELEVLLSDYIPYAKSANFIDLQFEKGEITKVVVDERYHTDIEECVHEREYSIARLFELFGDSFKEMLQETFSLQQSTFKLNKRLSYLVSSKLVPHMLNNRSDYYLGNDAKEMLHRSYAHLIDFSEYEMALSLEELEHHQLNAKYSYSDFINDLVDADIVYIESLADIQIKSEGYPDIDLLFNRWQPDMCLASKQ